MNKYKILISNGQGAASRGWDVDGYYTFETEAETVEEACTKAYIDYHDYETLEEFILDYYYGVDSVEQLEEDEKAEYEENLKSFNGKDAFDEGDISGGDPWIEGIMVNGKVEVAPDVENMRMYGYEFTDKSYKDWKLPRKGCDD